MRRKCPGTSDIPGVSFRPPISRGNQHTFKTIRAKTVRERGCHAGVPTRSTCVLIPVTGPKPYRKEAPVRMNLLLAGLPRKSFLLFHVVPSRRYGAKLNLMRASTLRRGAITNPRPGAEGVLVDYSDKQLKDEVFAKRSSMNSRAMSLLGES
jgi:hypothetical protein